VSQRNPYPRGADLSVYPTVAVMREAYLLGYYRTYAHQADVRIGPVAAGNWINPEAGRVVRAEMRPTCHAIIVLPLKVLLMRFARRATMKDIERLEYERALLAQTPELAVVAHWRIEARLVHCDIADGVEELARDRGIVLKVYRPRWLAKHRPRNLPNPRHGFIVRRFDPERLRLFALAHGGAAGSRRSPEERITDFRTRMDKLTPEQRSERSRKAMLTHWSQLTATERSAINRQRGAGLWGTMTPEQRRELGARLNEAKRRASKANSQSGERE
jgi:hypothetical protein